MLRTYIDVPAPPLASKACDFVSTTFQLLAYVVSVNVPTPDRSGISEVYCGKIPFVLIDVYDFIPDNHKL